MIAVVAKTVLPVPRLALPIIGTLILALVLAAVCGEGIATAEEVNRQSAADSVGTQAPDAAVSPLVQPGDTPRMRITVVELIVAAVGVLVVWFFFGSRMYRLNRAPARPEVASPPIGLLMLLLLVLAMPLGAAIAGTLFGVDTVAADDEDSFRAHALLMAGVYVLQLLLILGLVHMARNARSLRRDTRPGHASAALIGFGSLILIWPVLMTVSMASNATMVLFTGERPEPIAHNLLLMLTDQPWDGWAMFLVAMVIVCAPLIEEVKYRGLAQDAIARVGFSRWSAIAVASVFFTLMHIPAAELHALPTLFVLSLGFGWVYEKTGRIIAPIMMHAAFNAGNLALAMM